MLTQQSSLKEVTKASAFDVEDLLQRASVNLLALRLNFFKKAKLAQSFKWRLIEKGIAPDVADGYTQSLVLQLSGKISAPLQRDRAAATPLGRLSPVEAKRLLAQANQCFERGAYADAAALYRNVVEFDPRDIGALFGLGNALSKMGFLAEAEQHLRRAIASMPGSAEASFKLGVVLRQRGELRESDIWLRRAIKLRPNFAEARIHHGITLLGLNRVREAKARFAKVLKTSPRNAEAIFLMGHVARVEGHFAEAEARFRDALKINPKMPHAWAALAGVRKMTTEDSTWLQVANNLLETTLSLDEEIELRFAIGKFCDDLNDYEQAFRSFKRANELLKAMAAPYDRDAREGFVDDMIRLYTAEVIAHANEGGSQSTKPIFVVGMPRSGTSLVEQIIASHPRARGAGELGFCDDSAQGHDSELRHKLHGSLQKQKLAQTYLRALEAKAGDAARVVDKAPVNSDYLGVIYSVFPNARIIYMRRDPIDTCLSCYFQYFSPAMNFSMDLADLSHYFVQHQRLMDHWRSVLPPQSVLEVPYRDLVADQESWIRKILEFSGLEWDERCLNFQATERAVATASAWQVRQKIYRTSVARWRKYEKFIGPLRRLARD